MFSSNRSFFAATDLNEAVFCIDGLVFGLETEPEAHPLRGAGGSLLFALIQLCSGWRLFSARGRGKNYVEQITDCDSRKLGKILLMKRTAS